MRAALPAPASGSLSHAVDAAVDACAAGASARGVSVVRDDVPALRVAIDADRLTLVLVNLLDNAIKHGRAGGRVAIGVTVEDASVAIAVDDDGPGIGRSQIERLFTLGERGATSA